MALLTDLVNLSRKIGGGFGNDILTSNITNIYNTVIP